MHTTDIGLNRKDRGDVRIYPQTDGLKEEIAKLSSIAEVYPDENDPLFPSHSRSYRSFTDWEGKPASVEGLTIQIIPCNNRYFEFYGLQLLKGKLPEGDTERHILLNEAAVKELKIDNPIGKTLSRKDQKGFIIDGIFKDFYIAPPTVPVKPVMLEFSPGKRIYRMIIQRLPYSGISREAANCANNRLNSWQRKCSRTPSTYMLLLWKKSMKSF